MSVPEINRSQARRSRRLSLTAPLQRILSLDRQKPVGQSSDAPRDSNVTAETKPFLRIDRRSDKPSSNKNASIEVGPRTDVSKPGQVEIGEASAASIEQQKVSNSNEIGNAFSEETTRSSRPNIPTKAEVCDYFSSAEDKGKKKHEKTAREAEKKELTFTGRLRIKLGESQKDIDSASKREPRRLTKKQPLAGSRRASSVGATTSRLPNPPISFIFSSSARASRSNSVQRSGDKKARPKSAEAMFSSNMIRPDVIPSMPRLSSSLPGRFEPEIPRDFISKGGSETLNRSHLSHQSTRSLQPKTKYSDLRSSANPTRIADTKSEIRNQSKSIEAEDAAQDQNSYSRVNGMKRNTEIDRSSFAASLDLGRCSNPKQEQYDSSLPTRVDRRSIASPNDSGQSYPSNEAGSTGARHLNPVVNSATSSISGTSRRTGLRLTPSSPLTRPAITTNNDHESLDKNEITLTHSISKKNHQVIGKMSQGHSIEEGGTSRPKIDVASLSVGFVDMSKDELKNSSSIGELRMSNRAFRRSIPGYPSGLRKEELQLNERRFSGMASVTQSAAVQIPESPRPRHQILKQQTTLLASEKQQKPGGAIGNGNGLGTASFMFSAQQNRPKQHDASGWEPGSTSISSTVTQSGKIHTSGASACNLQAPITLPASSTEPTVSVPEKRPSPTLSSNTSKGSFSENYSTASENGSNYTKFEESSNPTSTKLRGYSRNNRTPENDPLQSGDLRGSTFNNAASPAHSDSVREATYYPLPSRALAKLFVICCHCKFWHDVPPKLYERLALPNPSLTNKFPVALNSRISNESYGSGSRRSNDRNASLMATPSIYSTSLKGENGSLKNSLKDEKQPSADLSALSCSDGVKCCWCDHSMNRSCCEGWTTVVYMHERHH